MGCVVCFGLVCHGSGEAVLSVNVLGSEKADAIADAVKPGRPPRVRVFTDL